MKNHFEKLVKEENTEDKIRFSVTFDKKTVTEIDRLCYLFGIKGRATLVQYATLALLKEYKEEIKND